MDSRISLFFGVAIGAGLMYLFDPDRGRRRRSLIRDQVVHGAHEIEDMGGGIASHARHLKNRAKGAVMETRGRLRRDDVDDQVLEARVRSELGRLVPDPSSIQVSSEHGRVTLRGHAAQTDYSHIVDGVQNVPGVHDVINRLEAREGAG